MDAAPNTTPRAERASSPFVMIESLGPLALAGFDAPGFELAIYRTDGATSYALARTGEEPLDERLVTKPMSEFGAYVLAFEILAGELSKEHLEDFAKTLAAYVFAKEQDTGGIARQRRHLEKLARDHGFGGGE